MLERRSCLSVKTKKHVVIVKKHSITAFIPTMIVSFTLFSVVVFTPLRIYICTYKVFGYVCISTCGAVTRLYASVGNNRKFFQIPLSKKAPLNIVNQSHNLVVEQHSFLPTMLMRCYALLRYLLLIGGVGPPFQPLHCRYSPLSAP